MRSCHSAFEEKTGDRAILSIFFVSSGTCPDYVHELPSDNNYLRIWTKKGTVARNPNSFVNGGDYIPSGQWIEVEKFDWQIRDIMNPTVWGDKVDLWVEGVRPTLNDDDGIITVEFKPGSPAPDTLIVKDEVRVSVLELKAYRDSACTKVLDDWSYWRENNIDYFRSPKCYFGMRSPIVLLLRGWRGKYPATQEILYKAVQIQSSSSSELEIDLEEHPLYTNIFQGYCFLGRKTGYTQDDYPEWPTNKIGAKDEEILNFLLNLPNDKEYKKTGDVMVDRGEFLAIGGSAHFVGTINTIVEAASIFCYQMRDLMFTPMFCDPLWRSNGIMFPKWYILEPSPAELQLEQLKKTAFSLGYVPKDPALDSCSDLIAYAGHGDEEVPGILSFLSGDPYVYWHVINDRSNLYWAKGEVEFIIALSCQSIGTKFMPDWVVTDCYI